MRNNIKVLLIVLLGIIACFAIAQDVNGTIKLLPKEALSVNKIILPNLNVGKDTQAIELSVKFTKPNPTQNFGEWLGDNMWSMVLLVLFIFDLLFRFTPSEVDNSILNLFWKLYNTVFPNRRQGGGEF